MKCPYCNERLDLNYRFCPWCGKEINKNGKPDNNKNHKKRCNELGPVRITAAAVVFIMMVLVLAVNIKGAINDKKLGETTMIVTKATTETINATESAITTDKTTDSETELSINQTNVTAVETIQSTDSDSLAVYITPTGKKYHLRKSCAGKNAIETTLGKAKRNYNPCKKCAQ